MKYTHIVFDVDGTLLNTAQCILEALKNTLEEVTGRSPRISELGYVLGMTSENALRSLSVPEDIIPSFIEKWVQREESCSDLITPFSEIEELLARLDKAGARLGIVTSRTRSELSLVFRNSSLARFFSTVICADETPEPKPSPAPLLIYMEQTGAAPEDILYVGDSEHDMECARRAGTHSALAVWGTLIPDTDATYHPQTPSELSPIILGS